MLKKSISVLLVVVMMFSIFSITAQASETNQNSSELSSEFSSDNFSTAGSTSFGSMLSEKIQENSSKLDNNGNHISNVVVTDKTATVTFDTTVECTILIGLFDEKTDQLLASGKASVTKDDKKVNVLFECDTMPKYFTLKGYMLDSDNSPVSVEYSSPLYTESIQKVKELNAKDFDSEKVLKLSEDDKTNFAVYKDDTIKIPLVEGSNVPEVIDNTNGKYVFSNASEQMKSLKQGDTFSYAYSEKEILIVKVDTITVNGSTVTITQKNVSLEDAFEYVKVESKSDSSAGEYEDTGLRKGITYKGKGDIKTSEENSLTDDNTTASHGSNLVPSGGDGTDFTNEMKLNFDLDKVQIGDDDNHVELNGKVVVSAKVELDVYICPGSSYLEFSIGYKGEFNLSIDAKLTMVFVELGKMSFMPVPGVNIVFSPEIVLEAKVSAKYTVEFTGSMGFSCTEDKGLVDKSKNPDMISRGTIEGEIFVGFRFEPQINLVCDALASAYLDGTAGLQIKGKLETTSHREDPDVNHDCKACIEGEINMKFELKADAKFFNCIKFEATLLEISSKLTDWHYSFDYNEFEFSACSHKSYRTLINVTRNDTPCKEVKVYNGKTTSDELIGTTTKDGAIETFLTQGKHWLNIDGVLCCVEVPDSYREFNIDLEREAAKVLSGKCGDTCYWELTPDGTLRIFGEGKMEDYQHFLPSTWLRDQPWKGQRNLITDVVIEDGVTYIGAQAFYGCENLSNITIFGSVKKIGNYAFFGSESLANIDLPNDLEIIGEYAFAFCSNLSDVNIPNTIINIKAYAFDYCSSLKSIDIPDSVTEIGSGAFTQSGLKTINLSKNISTIKSETFNGCKDLSEIFIPYGVTSIEKEAFFGCKSLNNVNITDSVKSIGDRAFSACTNLSYIKMSKNIQSVGLSAFYDTAWYNNQPYGMLYLGKVAYYYKYDYYETKPTNIDVNVKDGTTVIACDCFSSRSRITSITLPKSIITIDKYAFSSCIGLKSIDIPDSVKVIGEGAFSGCTALKTVKFMGNCPYFKRNYWSRYYQFSDVTATCYYPANNSTWTEDKRQNYGGNLTWVPYDADAETTDTSASISSLPNQFSEKAVAPQNISEATESPEQISESSSTATVLTTELNNLMPNEDYFVVAVNSSTSTDLLSASNLQYFSQMKSDENGVIQLSYTPKTNTVPTVMAFSTTNKNICKTEIKISSLNYSASAQTPEYTVTYNGKKLVENIDFIVSGDKSVTEPGDYYLTFTGVNGFFGTTKLKFHMYDFYCFGDVDMNSVVNIQDATVLQQYLAGNETLSDDALALADVDNNRKVDIFDVTLIQFYVAGIVIDQSRAGLRSAIVKY